MANYKDISEKFLQIEELKRQSDIINRSVASIGELTDDAGMVLIRVGQGINILVSASGLVDLITSKKNQVDNQLNQSLSDITIK
jgi:hypothetical protein